MRLCTGFDGVLALVGPCCGVGRVQKKTPQVSQMAPLQRSIGFWVAIGAGLLTNASQTRWSCYFFFGAGFLAFCKLAYVPAANLVWNFSIRPAVSTNFSLPV